MLPMLAAALTAAAPVRIVVFPIEGHGVANDSVNAVYARLVNSLERDPTLEVISADDVSSEIGVDLGEQARDCDNDLLCLIQIGELVGGERLLLGKLKRHVKGFDDLRLSVVDVEKAHLVDTLRWKIPARSGALYDAVSIAGRMLAGKPDAQVFFDVFPEDLELVFYGSPSRDLELGKPTEFWSGIYYGRATRAGYEPRDVRISIPAGGPTRVTVELESDPLWVGPGTRKANITPVPGARGRSDTVVPEADEGWPWGAIAGWSVVGVGAAVAGLGGVLMNGAQDRYNEVAGQTRYTEMTTAVADARRIADDTTKDYGLGTRVMIGGVSTIVLGLTWVIIDAATGSDDVSVAVTGTGGSVGVRF